MREPLAARERLARVARVERALGVALPGSYIGFLVDHYGRALPDRPLGFRVGVMLDPWEIEVIEQLFTVGTRGVAYELVPNARRYRVYLPPDRLLIGRVLGGNALCLVLEGVTAGAIAFLCWDGRRFVDRGNLALSMQSFLERLLEL